MPRHDHQVATERVLPYEVQMVLTVLLGELNTLRTQAGLAPRTAEQMRQAVRQYLRSHARPGQGG
jgi:hypothetical protein